MRMDLWYTEKQTQHHGITTLVTETLHVKKTPYQDLAVIDTPQWGRMLVLDGCVMTSVADEFVYHEMIAHVPLCAHPQPKRVLVIGGGDGGAIREILRHPTVERAVLAEIDGDVIEASRAYLPEIACGLADPRVEICVGDGIAHVKEHPDTYDVILVDSTDPVGPAVGLFSREFYADIHAALRADGLFVAQSESPFFNAELIARMQADVRALFPIAGLYLAAIPTYPSGLWSFTVGSKRHDPRRPVDQMRAMQLATRYYTPELHEAAFALPRFAQNLLASRGDAR